MDSVTELEGSRALVVDGSWAGEPVRLINVYAPSDVGERRELFQRLRPQLVTSRTIMMGGDFNCILESGGRCGTMVGEGWMDDAVKLLAEMVGEASLTDVIGSMGPDASNFTWSRPDGSVRSRIDFVFTSKSVRIRQHSLVTVHFSDHRGIRFQGELTGKLLTGPGTWKVNSSLLGREDVHEELRRTYSEWQDMKDTFQSVGEWWEWVKGRIQDFFKNVGRKAARGRRKEFSRLQQQLQELHDLQLRGWDVMNPLEAVKKELSEHFHDKSRRIIFCSKVENLEKGEKCNSFFFKKIHSAHTPLVQLRNREGILCDTREDIRKAVTDFSGDLYSEKRSDGATCGVHQEEPEHQRDPDTIRHKERSQVHAVHGRRHPLLHGWEIGPVPAGGMQDFGKASGAKINMDKSQAKLFGRWDLCNEPLPFPIEAGLVKILCIWFEGAGAAAKSWNERLAKVKQKLGFWSLRHLSIEGKALVLRNDALPVLQSVTQAWPLLANIARAVNSMVFHFVWHSKMDRVKRTVMHKEHRKGGKAVPDIQTILRAFFVCGCVRITLMNENKDNSAYRVFRFLLLPVWRTQGCDKWENATMFNWDLPWYY
ncbi:hypothetical protein NDU88_002168 [Pleurodeles waltl]|uniref:Endonuclease/exonuclease/phosphatase domain-containing protein n=1 Tax=Pleurodeles waltl TaxID=8319 RepID=A0AAV7P961_PLEWA|nr:hypothetical protein NDU88_002168 [Pleurodeles waltl]